MGERFFEMSGKLMLVGFIALFVMGAIPTYVVLSGLLFISCFVGYLIAYQESVLYIPVIQGIKTPDDNPPSLKQPHEQGLEYEDVYIPVDGLRIHGWFMPAPADKERSAPTLLFCHENAGNIGLRLQEAKHLHQRLRVNLFFFDYRGFGFSEGVPTEEGLVRDAEAALRWLHRRAADGKINPNSIFVTGRSLGGAVAIQLAARLSAEQPAHPPAGVILENTFTCIEEMVGSVFAPLGWIIKWSPALKNKFLRLQWRSIDVIDQVTYPILMLSSLEDEIVPASHMVSLQAKATASKSCTMETYHAGHNDLWQAGGKKYWETKMHFIHSCSAQC